MALCMQPPRPMPHGEFVSEVERVAPKKTLQASEPGRLTPLPCLLLLLAKTQVEQSLYLLQCPSLFLGSSMSLLCRGPPNLSQRPIESHRSLSRGGRGQHTILSNLYER